MGNYETRIKINAWTNENKACTITDIFRTYNKCARENTHKHISDDNHQFRFKVCIPQYHRRYKQFQTKIAIDCFLISAAPNDKITIKTGNRICSFSFNLDALALKTWGQRLSQFVSLLGVLNLQCVQVTRASDLELGFGVTLADLDKLGITSACLLKEVSDISNLLWHCCVLSERKQIG